MSQRAIQFPWQAISALFLMLLVAAAASAAESDKLEPALSIVKADILDSEDGYPVDPESLFFPGERVHLLFNVGGYTRGQYDRVKLRWRVESFGPEGERFVVDETGSVDAELAPQDKKWLPIIRHSPMIPPHGGAGLYRVVLTVVDELAEEEVTKEVLIHVGGMRVEGAGELTIRSIRFSRREGGEKLAEAVFRPGETFWVTFYITGYRLGDNNAFDLRTDIRLVNEEGKGVLTLEPEEVEGSAFYPRRWLPATVRLDLDPAIPHGEYFLLVQLDDRLAGKTHQASYSFRVR